MDTYFPFIYLFIFCRGTIEDSGELLCGNFEGLGQGFRDVQSSSYPSAFLTN